MPDAPPEVVLIGQLPADYALPGEWEARVATFRLLSGGSGLIGGCEPAREGEITVCARAHEAPYTGPAFPAEGPIGEQLARKLTYRRGALEAGPMPGPNSVGVGVRIKF